MPLLIFTSAFLIRIIVQYYMGCFISPETWEYEKAVNNFFAGRGLVFDIYGTTYNSLLTPLYPILCILTYALSGHSFFVMAVIASIISSLICVVIFFLGRDLFGAKVGFLAGVLTILHPGLVVYTSKFHPLVLDSLLFCVVIRMLIKTRKKPDYLNQLKLGLIFGLTMLSRSTILLFLPVSWLWLKRKSSSFFIIFIFTSIIVLTPWLVRNYIIHKKILIVSSSANVFWRGNNPLATGTSLGPSGKPMLEEAGDIMSLIYGKTEIEQNRIFIDASLRFIKNNPSKFIKLTLKKLYYFWWFSPDSGSEYKKEWLVIYRAFYSLALLFAISGFFGFRNLEPPIRYDIAIVLLLMLTISLAQSLFYVEIRHRWAIEPLMLIFTAKGLVYAGEKIKEKFPRTRLI